LKLLLIALLLALSQRNALAQQPAPRPAGPVASAAASVKPEEEARVVELMYYVTAPDGKSVGVPGPDDDLVQIIRHRNGKLWPGQPVDFDITTGSRLISVKKGVPPYVRHLTAITDRSGIARVFLQPLP
jgi:hypothetical protein